MQIQRTALVVLVVTSLSALSGQAAWSQNVDPFGGTPAGASQQKKAKKLPTRSSPTVLNHAVNNSVDHPASNRAAEILPGGLPRIHAAITNQNESEMRIHAAFRDSTTNMFFETPLDEAMQTISKNHDIPILINQRALEEIGLTPETPVTLALKSVSLRSFLRLLLRELDLTYMIQDEVLQITTIEAAEQNLQTQMYRLPDNLVSNSDKVLMALQLAVVPDTWNTRGGPSLATSIDHVLILSTTSDVHHQVEDFLNTLIETYGK